ncbi:MAG: hypothetical protein R2844_17850 [Caldilineales bacterium]
MSSCYLDEQNRFVIKDFNASPAFASFLPGIAGPLGVPLWAFYVNRGQAMASFGVETKDSPILEFEPASKAYQTTPASGFRTFLKHTRAGESRLYEPFAPWTGDDVTRLIVDMNELQLQARSTSHGLQTDVAYFTLSNEPFGGLVRMVTVTNIGSEPAALEMLDGLPRVIPFGIDNRGLKEIGRTLEAWMAVFNLEQRIPFFRLQASADDSAEVAAISAGHFCLAFADSVDADPLLPVVVDPQVAFLNNTSLHTPDGFVSRSLTELLSLPQITQGKTPCALFGMAATLAPGEARTLVSITGHAGDIRILRAHQERIANLVYVRLQRAAARELALDLTGPVATRTALPRFDGYCRQTFLDNVLRGGWPLLLGEPERPHVYHIYSRKHGDLERDYNAFFLAAEPYSQGNGNYRDVNQNRRSDVFFNPAVGDTAILDFLALIQPDGYNPLVINGGRFTLPDGQHAGVLGLADHPDRLRPLLAQPFTPGGLLRAVSDHQIELKVAPESFVQAALAGAERHFEATFGEGFWIDHWTYILDLIDAYVAVYPDRKEELLFDGPVVPWFDSPAFVRPRSGKVVLTGDGKVRQYGAVAEDEEKAALIASRQESPHFARTAHGQGEVYRSTVFAKLASLALIKFATLDPLGVGVEMEAGKPGWYDAANGLPGLFGSSLPETYELQRLLEFLLAAIDERGDGTIELPVELIDLLNTVSERLDLNFLASGGDDEFSYWDDVASAREAYRARVRLGFDGATGRLALSALAQDLQSFLSKVRAGLRRAVAMNDGVPPTYLTYEATGYQILADEAGLPAEDAHGRALVRVTGFAPHLLPLFLEGPTHAMKLQATTAGARSLHERIRGSDLFDAGLGMYKVNASLAAESHEIGRARAFTPGWLENESIWLHMEAKYLLELLKAGLYDEFFAAMRQTLPPFLDPETYGRSPLESSSFIVSSAHPDASLHGRGFVARLSGATAEFLSMWTVMMAGRQPFLLHEGDLHLALRPALPSWLFDERDQVRFTFLGRIPVTYHNPARHDTWRRSPAGARLTLVSGETVRLPGAVIGPPYAEMVRAGEVDAIELYFDSQSE